MMVNAKTAKSLGLTTPSSRRCPVIGYLNGASTLPATCINSSLATDLLAPFTTELAVRRGRLCTGTSSLSSISRGEDIGDHATVTS